MGKTHYGGKWYFYFLPQFALQDQLFCKQFMIMTAPMSASA